MPPLLRGGGCLRAHTLVCAFQSPNSSCQPLDDDLNSRSLIGRFTFVHPFTLLLTWLHHEWLDVSFGITSRLEPSRYQLCSGRLETVLGTEQESHALTHLATLFDGLLALVHLFVAIV
jgi:hypothetical protein